MVHQREGSKGQSSAIPMAEKRRVGVSAKVSKDIGNGWMQLYRLVFLHT